MDRFEEIIKKISGREYGVQSFMLLRHGKVIREGYRAPFRKEDKHSLFSVSKCFTALGVGLLMDEGLLHPSDRVADLFREYLPSPACPNMEKMTVEDLLTMRGGFDIAPDDLRRHHIGEVFNDFPYSFRDRKSPDGTDWARDIVRSYVAEEPGRDFLYSSACSYLLSAIIQKKTGMTLKDYVGERLFSRLGITDYYWQHCPKGRTTGGWGLSMRLEDMARCASFLLDGGRIGGEQILDEGYVRKMCSPIVTVSEDTSVYERHYGYQTWVLGDGECYGGIGAFGQFMLIYPEYDAVLAMFSMSKRYMEMLAPLTDDMIRALRGEDDEGYRDLSYLLDDSLYLNMIRGPVKEIPSGDYVFSRNIYGINALSFREDGPDISVNLTINGTEARISAGTGVWKYGSIPFSDDEELDIHDTMVFSKTAARAGSGRNGELHIVLVFYETGYILDMECRTSGNSILLKIRRNVGFVLGSSMDLTGIGMER